KTLAILHKRGIIPDNVEGNVQLTHFNILELNNPIDANSAYNLEELCSWLRLLPNIKCLDVYLTELKYWFNTDANNPYLDSFLRRIERLYVECSDVINAKMNEEIMEPLLLFLIDKHRFPQLRCLRFMNCKNISSAWNNIEHWIDFILTRASEHQLACVRFDFIEKEQEITDLHTGDETIAITDLPYTINIHRMYRNELSILKSITSLYLSCRTRFRNHQTGNRLDSNGDGAAYGHALNGGAYQVWHIINIHNNCASLKNDTTGLFLDSDHAGGVCALPSNKSAHQRCRFDGLRIINDATGRALDSDHEGKIGLLVRIYWQKHRIGQSLKWRKHWRMTVQLSFISINYLFLALPLTLLKVAGLIGIRHGVTSNLLEYSIFLNYCRVLVCPITLTISLPQVKQETNNILQAIRRAGTITPIK
ncbi:unnamed protein product, partial [Rotaria socialis]